MHPVFMPDYADGAVIFLKPATHHLSLPTVSVVILNYHWKRLFG